MCVCVLSLFSHITQCSAHVCVLSLFSHITQCSAHVCVLSLFSHITQCSAHVCVRREKGHTHEHLTSVRYSSERQQLPDNPERFDKCPSALGSEGFNSGTHCWDVEVGKSEDRILVVKTDSIQSKGGSVLSGVWGVFHDNGVYTALSPPRPYTLLTVK